MALSVGLGIVTSLRLSRLIASRLFGMSAMAPGIYPRFASHSS
jgi:hypothetical protein